MIKGSRQNEGSLDHDEKTYRERHDEINFAKKPSDYMGREVAKEDLPAGVRCRIVYGKKQ